MSKRQWLIIFGILVIVLPFSGFPLFWQKIIFAIIGLIIITISYSKKKLPKISEDNHSTAV